MRPWSKSRGPGMRSLFLAVGLRCASTKAMLLSLLDCGRRPPGDSSSDSLGFFSVGVLRLSAQTIPVGAFCTGVVGRNGGISSSLELDLRGFMPLPVQSSPSLKANSFAIVPPCAWPLEPRMTRISRAPTACSSCPGFRSVTAFISLFLLESVRVRPLLFPLSSTIFWKRFSNQ